MTIGEYTRPYKAIADHMGLYNIIQDYRRHNTIQDHSRSKETI